MSITEDIYAELENLGLRKREDIKIKEIRNKDGVFLFRVEYEEQFFVLKYFINREYTREIKNYSILNGLNIPTIKSFGYTDKSILLEDIDKSEEYRLGVEADLSDVEVAKALAKWYIDLHKKGTKYIAENNDVYYREIDIITKENIEMIREKSNTRDNRVWDLILQNIQAVLDKTKGLGETLTYNDFYYTNLIVRKDKKEALMFDYNLLGVGLRYSDIRNVCSSLSHEAGEAFVNEYGGFNHTEKVIDDCLSDLINLIFAYKRAEFPKWAEKSLGTIHNGELEKSFKCTIELLFK